MIHFPEVTNRSKIGRAIEIISSFNGGKPSDDRDTRLIRLVMSSIDSVYAEVLKEDLQRKQILGEDINPQTYFSYSCEPIELAQSACEECSSSYRVKLPELAQYYGYPLITNVGTDVVKFTQARNKQEAITLIKGRPYMPSKPAYYILGDFMYVVLPPKYKKITRISFDVVTTTPSRTSDDVCFDIWSDEYPIMENLWNVVKDRVVQRLIEPNIRTRGVVVQDEINDGK